jgi:hypothetical protein
VVPMLLHFVQQDTAHAAATSSSRSSSQDRRGSTTAGSSSSSRIGRPSASHQPALDSRAGNYGLTVAFSLPAAYSSMLLQLTCSGEVGLWLATTACSKVQYSNCGRGSQTSALRQSQ